MSLFGLCLDVLARLLAFTKRSGGERERSGVGSPRVVGPPLSAAAHPGGAAAAGCAFAGSARRLSGRRRRAEGRGFCARGMM